MHDRDELIRKRAHQIWEDAGRPEGQEEAHWQRAQAEIDSLAEEGDSAYAADTRRNADVGVEEVLLNTTRESAAFAMAASTPARKK